MAFQQGDFKNEKSLQDSLINHTGDLDSETSWLRVVASLHTLKRNWKELEANGFSVEGWDGME